jgi:3-deoxy-D-manno-octulosonic-acid transferase
MMIRLGRVPNEYIQLLKGKKHIWIHAVSVGEVLLIQDLLQRLKSEYPQYSMVCSTVTWTGYQMAKERLSSGVTVIFAPIDFSGAVSRFIELINPVVYISTETEIWPNMYRVLQKRGVPIALVNGRISDVSFRRYRWIYLLTKRVLGAVRILCVQSQREAQRLIALGADQAKIRIVGNLKFDHAPQASRFSREKIGYDAGHQVLLAGSTHPGEEERILEVYQKYRSEFPGLRLILAPRHVERVEEVLKIIRSRGISTVKLSQLDGYQVKDQILVVDSIGQLGSLYEIADIVFVGKSLVDGGGQNILEPAWFSKPIIVGPYTQNFRDAVQLFLRDGAIKQVRNERQFADVLVMFLRKPDDRIQMGRQARLICEANVGATQKTFNEIIKLID